MNNEIQHIAPKETVPMYDIRLLGEFTVSYNEIQVDALNYPRIAAILAYLLLAEGREVSRAELARVFYPDHPKIKCLQNIRASLHNILKLFPELIETSKQTCRLSSRIDARIDVVLLLAKARQIHAQMRYSQTLYSELSLCVELYKGELLPGLSADWLDGFRDELRTRVSLMLKMLCKFARQIGNFDEAMLFSQKLSSLEPDKEDGRQEILKTLRDSGESLAMINYFEAYQQKLQDEIGEDPMPETFEIVYGNPVVSKSSQAKTSLAVPYMGRDKELSSAERHIRLYIRDFHGKNRTSMVTAICGAPGYGKTGFIGELSRFLEKMEIDYIIVSCKSLREYSGYALVRKIINECCIKGKSYFIWCKLSDFCVRALVSYFPELGKLFPDLHQFPDIDTTLKQDRFHEAIKEFLASLASESPFVIFIEDFHWIPDDDMQLIMDNIEFLHSINTHFILTFRPQEFSGVLEKHSQFKTVLQSPRTYVFNLHAFDKDNTKQLISTILDCTEVDETLTAAIFRQTGGNPYFIIKTLQNLVESHQLTSKNKLATFNEKAINNAEGFVDNGIEDTILASYRNLPDTHRMIMELVSAAGFPLQPNFMQFLISQNIENELKTLMKWQYLKIDEQGITVFHELMKDAIYNSLETNKKKQLHNELYKACVALQSDIEVACYHAVNAELPRESLWCSIQAAQSSVASFSYKRAMEHAQRALDLLEHDYNPEIENIKARTEILSVLRLIYVRSEQFEKWKDVMLELKKNAAILNDTELVFETELNCARDFFYVRDWEGNSMDHLAKLHDDAQKTRNTTAEAEVLQLIAQKHRLNSNYEKAAMCLKQAIALVESTHDHTDLELAYKIDLANVLTCLCKEKELHGLLISLDTTIDKRQPSRNLYMYLYTAIFHAIRSMAFQDALEKADLFISTVVAMGITYNAVNGYHCRSLVLRNTHRYKEAEESLEKAFKLNGTAKIQILDMMCKREMANVYMASGRLNEAMDLVQYLIENHELEHGNQKYQNTKLIEINILLMQHKIDEASERIEAYKALKTGPDTMSNEVYRLQLEAMLAVEREEYSSSIQLLTKIFERGDETGKKAELWGAKALAGYCHAKTGNFAAALELTRSAYEELAMQNFNGSTSSLVQVCRFMALMEYGNKDEAYHVLETAHKIIMQNADRLENEAWKQAYLSNIPEHDTLLDAWTTYQKTHTGVL